jgi:hypothetical protein
VENICNNVDLSPLLDQIWFLDAQIASNPSLYEMISMVLDYTEKLVNDVDYCKSEKAIFRGANLIEQLQTLLFRKYPKETSIIIQEFQKVSAGFQMDPTMERMVL